MATITQPQYDTPIGVGGKIDTNTGKILSGQMQGQQAQLQTPKNITFAPPASNIVDVKDVGARPYTMPNAPQTNITPMTNNVPPPSTAETQQTQTTPDAPSDAKWGKLLSSLGIQDSIDEYSKKGEATVKAQQDAQLAQKREQATRDYNALMGARLEQAQTIERMRTSNPTGAFGGAGDQFIREYTAKSNADIANLSFTALASQGLLAAAEQTVKDKIDAQFEPIKDKITMLSQFAELNQNDLSESDSLKLQSQIRLREQEAKSVQDASAEAHKLVIENGGDPSVFSEFDKITRDYAAGKITAAEAQGKYYAAAGRATGTAADGMTPAMSFEEYVKQAEQEMQASIVPGSALYKQLQQEYQQLAGGTDVSGMASNLRSLVAKTGPAAAIFDKAYNRAASQGTEEAERFLRSQYINNVLSGSERENYNNVQNGLEMYREAIKYLEENPDLKTGFWKETAEGLKPKLGVPNDPRYATLLSLINNAEAPIRKAQYGTAITGTELSLAMRSLLNTDQDRDTTMLKMRQAVVAYENGLNRNMANALGTVYTPKPIPTPGKSAPIEGEDIYSRVLGETYEGGGDYQTDVNTGIQSMLNQLFVGI